MKPYIAILIDSFWEAVRNKVLWALLIGWSLILLALAPFGYISERSFKLSSSDIDNRGRLVEKLAKAAKGQGSLDARAVAEHLEPDFLERVKKEVENKTPGKSLSERELAKALNVAISSQGLYSQEAFPTAERRKRLTPLIEQASEGENLNEADLEELNRELLKLAFPLELASPRAEQLYIGYAGFKLGEPLGITRRQISQFLEPVLLGVIIKIGLGVVAVFVALIVTSSIIPDTFKTGSLHLLLSKPISRVWLFLSKFLGGCIFVLVNIAFVLVGLYLIAGTRFDIWNTGLLACIPLLMFVFVIFYSVSSLAGLLWGNPIVSVVTCMIFWLFCFGAGVVYEGMRPQVEVQQQVRKIRQIGENVLAVNEDGQLAIWNEKYSVWQPAIEPETRGQSRTFGPIYDEEHNLVVVKSFFRTPFGTLQGRSRKLSIVRLDDEESGEEGEESQEDVESAKDARDTPRWMADVGPELPQQVVDLIEADDAILAVTRSGIFKLNVEMLEAAEATETALFGFKLPWAATNAFQKISPSDFYLSENTAATTHANGEGIVVHSSGDVSLLKPKGEQFEVVAQVSLKNLPLERKPEQEDDSPEDASVGDGTEPAIAQMNERFCVVAREDLPLIILTADFELLGEVEVPGGAKVRQTSWIPGTDHLAIVTHTGELFELDCENRKIGPLTNMFFGECTSMNWLDSNRVWLGVTPNQAHLLNTSTGEVEQACVPARTTFENIFGLAVKPLYLINPKPSALDNAMNYLLSGNDTMATQFVTNDLEATQIELDIWQPIFSNLAFVAVILGICCVYVARKEF